MAVTGKFYNTLEFGTINSGDYGVYITGTGVYNAPARAVEMVSVPGRNGDVPIDMGHWDNIEVRYKCGLFGIDQSEMGEALMKFRNAIASQIGYQRLSDSYNPNEFRLGLFMAGFEFDAVSMNRAGEFELKFNCKPQRFLTDGEEMIDVKSDWSNLKTASDEVVTFEVEDDAAANYTQFKSLVADINPIQDLHGYDAPWVGGAGKNLFNMGSKVDTTFAGLTITSDDNNLIINGTKYGGSYWNSTVLAFTLPAGTYYAKSFASGTASAIPDVYITKDGNPLSTSIREEKTFTLTEETTVSVRVAFWTDNATYNNYKISIVVSKTSGIDKFYPYKNICPISGWDSVEAYDSPTESKEDGTTHTATFEETVYGGTVDLVSGVLTDKMGIVDLGTLNWNAYNGKFTSILTPEPLRKTFGEINMLCSIYKTGAYGGSSSQGDGTIWLSASTSVNTLYVEDSRYTDASAFKTAMNGVQLVYELAEPRTIQLDPQTINTLVGANNVWGDSGDVSVEYGVRPGVLVNPTQYESSPVIEIEGTGDVSLNDYVIAIDDSVVGEVELADQRSIQPLISSRGALTETIDMAETLPLLAEGDSFRLSSMVLTTRWNASSIYTYTVSEQPTDGTAAIEAASLANNLLVVARINPLTFTKGTAQSYTEVFEVTRTVSNPGGSSGSGSIAFTTVVSYDGASTLSITRTFSVAGRYVPIVEDDYGVIGAVIGSSSIPAFTGTVIIDSETGDAYRIEDGTYISLNKYIQLGAQLPTLRPGANIITYDDTIESLKIAPRWWRL